MDLVQRVKSILLQPKDTWVTIEAESADMAGLYTRYFMLLAAIPAVCGFIGMSIIGMGAFGVSIRVPFLSGLASMVVSYVLSLVGVFVLALIVNALAPTFGGQKDQIQALKLAVYASTAALVGGIFSLGPAGGAVFHLPDLLWPACADEEPAREIAGLHRRGAGRCHRDGHRHGCGERHLHAPRWHAHGQRR